MKIPGYASLISIFSLLLSFHPQIFSQNKIAFSLISSGGGQQSNSAYIINGSLGQTIIGKCENAINQAQAGFWQMYYQNVMVNVTDDDIKPIEFMLEQNYPNPFNPSTIIGYVLQEKSNAKLSLINILGEEVAILVNEEQDKGFHKVDINAANLPSGVYLYKLQAGNPANGTGFTETKKLMLLK
jgi:hypothetical protein